MKSYYDSVNDLGDWLLGKSKSEPQKEEEDFLKSAQTDFNNSLKNLTSYGSELVDQANKNLEDSKNKWFNWGSKQQDKINEDIEKQKSFATQQYELAKRKYNH